MTSRERRLAELRGLLADVRADHAAVTELFGSLSRLNPASIQDGADELFLRGIGASLHHIYTGIESMFERIALTLDGEVPKGGDSHRRLLVRMREAFDDVRPPVISKETFTYLDELRRFRHMFRHAYGAELEASRLRDLVRRTREALPALERDIDAFVAFLRELIQRGESESP